MIATRLRKLLSAVLWIPCLLAWQGSSLAYTPPSGSPLANRQHPRIWISNSELPALQAKLSCPSGSMCGSYQSWIDFLEGNWNNAGSGTDWEMNIANYAFVYRLSQGAGVSGINYRTHTPADYGTQARSLMMQLASQSPTRWNGQGFRAFEGLIALPLGYDWTHSLLSASERTQAVAHLKAYDAAAKAQYKQLWDDSSTAAMAGSLMAGLAFWGDGIDDGAANVILDRAQTGWFLNGGHWDAANYVAADDGGISEGINYSIHGTGNSTVLNLLRSGEAWRTANGLSKSTHYGGNNAAALRYYSQWITYLSLPDPNNIALKGWYDDAGNNYLSGSDALKSILGSLRVFKSIDPNLTSLTLWLMQNFGVFPGTGGTNGLYSAMESIFVFGEGGISAQSPAQLGLALTKKFDGLGQVIMRTGWGVNDSLVGFMASPYWRSFYTNRNQNSFSIQRKGPLAISAGSRVHHNYANDTWAYNTMIFPDPNDTGWNSFAQHDQGGQRWYTGGGAGLVFNINQLQPGSIFDIGPGITRFDPVTTNGQDYDYIFSDASRAYNGPARTDGKNVAKVKLFTRNFVYFRPSSPSASDRIVVFDRTETVGTQFEKRWLLHPSGTNITINGTQTKVRDGKWSYAGADRVTIIQNTTGSNGQLFCRTLLPTNPKIIKIGGPNNAGQNFVVDSHEYENPYGVQDEAGAGTNSDVKYLGNYRIEVIPATPSLKDNFLHVLEATDGGVASPSSTALLTGTGLVGARVGNRIAVFNNAQADVASGDIVIDVAGTYNVLLVDLTPGAVYNLQLAGANLPSKTASPAGTIYFSLTTTGANARLALSRGAIAPPTAPGITSHPQSISVTVGQTTNFNVTATGTMPFTYQWYSKPVGASGFSPITGATSALYTFANPQLSDSGDQFHVIVTNNFGAATSNAATITVTAIAPTISLNPQNQSVTAGQTATFNVSANGTAPLSYQWQSRPSGGAFADITGATNTTFTTSAAVLSDNGNQFRCVVFNSAGSVTSTPGTLTVTAAAVPPSIVQAPQNQSVTAGQNAVFSVTAGGSQPLSYQWQMAASGSSTFNNISGATSATYTAGSVLVSMSGQRYRVQVTNSAGSIVSSAATLTVAAAVVAPTINVQPQNSSVNVGGNVSFQVFATGSQPISYQWQEFVPGGLGFADILGANTSIYTVFGALLADNGTQYQCAVSNSAGAVLSSAATMTVVPQGSGAPVLNLLVPLNGSTILGDIITAAYYSTGNLAGVDHIQLVLDGGFPAQGFSLSGTYSFVNVPPGAHVLRAYLADVNNIKIPGTDVQTTFASVLNTAGGPLPAPVLNLPAFMPVNGTLALVYPPGYGNIGFSWTITLKNGAPGATLPARRASLPGALSANFQTSSNLASLGNYGLVPGLYTVAVQAFDSTGNISAQAQQDVTLVATNLSAIRVFPNPWRRDRHANNPITFVHLPIGSSVKIFTVSGHWVKTLTPLIDTVTWDLTNDHNDKVASGIYVYSINIDGDKKTGQIAVIK